MATCWGTSWVDADSLMNEIRQLFEAAFNDGIPFDDDPTDQQGMATKTYIEDVMIPYLKAIPPVNRYDATVAPTENDDTDAGYSVGSEWIDTVTGTGYKCTDASSGAAVWKQTTA